LSLPTHDFLDNTDNYPSQQSLQKTILSKMESLLSHNFGSSSVLSIIRDYPNRSGKMLRPIICISACGAVGGDINNSFNTAAAIELIHNAFLIKDDIVDGSDFRRGLKTLNRMHGFEIAVNVGDALKVISLSALLDNLELIGVRKSLQIMMEFMQMAKMSVEGQLMEVEWVKTNRVDLTQKDYFEMCVRKSCWYTCIGPCRTGIIIGSENATDKQLELVTEFATRMGLAFQIRDDTLNLLSTFRKYGKEINGDIWEGKRTVMLIHLLERCSEADKRSVELILNKPREEKKESEVNYVRGLIDKYDSLTYAQNLSLQYAKEATNILQEDCDWMTNNYWKKSLKDMVKHVVSRNK